MRKTTRVCFLLLILLLPVASGIRASDFRCGTDIISPGDRKFDVLRKCGSPANMEVREEVRIRRDFGSRLFLPGEEPPGLLFTKELVTVEEWEYNLGPGSFIRYLTFENGRLTKITTGDYGY